jgi:hypothetical protein
MTKSLISTQDYSRIYDVVTTLILKSGVFKDGFTPDEACLHLSLMAWGILKNHFDIKATLEVGTARILIGGPQGQGILLHLGKGTFHSWLYHESVVIDFQSPSFHETAVQEAMVPFRIPRKMFQRSYDAPNMRPDIQAVGDAFYLPDEGLRKKWLESNKDLSKPLMGDLVNAASQWFKRYPKKMPQGQHAFDTLKGKTSLKLIHTPIEGSW